MKIVISPYLSENSSDFDEILYTVADSELDERHVALVPNETRGQSNLTKSSSRGANFPVRGHPRGVESCTIEFLGRVSY